MRIRGRLRLIVWLVLTLAAQPLLASLCSAGSGRDVPTVKLCTRDGLVEKRLDAGERMPAHAAVTHHCPLCFGNSALPPPAFAFTPAAFAPVRPVALAALAVAEAEPRPPCARAPPDHVLHQPGAIIHV